MSRRRSDSVRFDPYWKVQWWDTISVTWRDIQRAYDDRDDAETAARRAAVDMGTRTRLMEVTEAGRRPVAVNYGMGTP